MLNHDRTKPGVLLALGCANFETAPGMVVEFTIHLTDIAPERPHGISHAFVDRFEGDGSPWLSLDDVRRVDRAGRRRRRAELLPPGDTVMLEAVRLLRPSAFLRELAALTGLGRPAYHRPSRASAHSALCVIETVPTTPRIPEVTARRVHRKSDLTDRPNAVAAEEPG